MTALVPIGNSNGRSTSTDSINERELIFKFLFDMKNDLNALKEQVKALTNGQQHIAGNASQAYRDDYFIPPTQGSMRIHMPDEVEDEEVAHTEVEESLSLEEKEKEMIRKALQKHRNRRRNAAQELGISERTLYRKIKEYDIK